MIKIIPMFIKVKLLEKLDLYENRKGIGKNYLMSIREIFKRNWKYSIAFILLAIIEFAFNIPFLIIKGLFYIPHKIYEFIWG